MKMRRGGIEGQRERERQKERKRKMDRGINRDELDDRKRTERERR
jgi:hypothetical protein